MPVIKITAIKEAMLGTHKAKQVEGTELSGKEFKRSFFAQQKDLGDQLAEFGIGDMVYVDLTKKGQYWNISGFREPTKEELRETTTPTRSPAPASTLRRADGGSRGDDTNRSAAIYLAREIVMGSGDCPKGIHEVVQKCMQVADVFIYPYIKDGIITPFESPKRGKREVAIPDPPEIEE